MEFRVLQYFLAVAREQSINKAAEALHMTQPPLSRQMAELEKELGKQLFVRGNRKITLTEEGMLLRKRAEELVELMEKTRAEVASADGTISGEVYLGGGESQGFRLIADAAMRLRERCPGVQYHLYSGNAQDVTERLDRGLLDFAVVIEPADLSKYECLPLTVKERWGVLLRKDHPLAEVEEITPEDLAGQPLLLSRQSIGQDDIARWFGPYRDSLQIVASYNLLYNASLLVEQGLGCALCLGGILPEYPGSPLCFRPLKPAVEADLTLIWKRYQVFSRAGQAFLEEVRGLGDIGGYSA